MVSKYSQRATLEDSPNRYAYWRLRSLCEGRRKNADCDMLAQPLSVLTLSFIDVALESGRKFTSTVSHCANSATDQILLVPPPICRPPPSLFFKRVSSLCSPIPKRKQPSPTLTLQDQSAHQTEQIREGQRGFRTRPPRAECWVRSSKPSENGCTFRISIVEGKMLASVLSSPPRS